MNQDNPMMIGFVKDEIVLKLFHPYDPMVISNALVSCITSFKKKLWPLMTSTAIDEVFFIKGNLSCQTNFFIK
jgi:hypothetical protein